MERVGAGPACLSLGMAINPATVAGIATLLVLALVGCSASSTPPESRPAESSADSPAESSSDSAPTPTATATKDVREPAPSPSSAPSTTAPTRSKARKALDALMRIDSIGVHNLRVVPYRGSPDDAPGTRIQDGGVAASPYGPGGGVGPGQIGNMLITAHRTSAGGPFSDLPTLRRGEHVLIRSGGRVYDYKVTETRSTSFRSTRSLARQSASVPGKPGVQATRAMVTLSTCATPEDHARGNYWSDAFGNPEHRIDKIGVLVAVRPA